MAGVARIVRNARRAVKRLWRRVYRLRPAQAKAFEDNRRSRAWLEKGRVAYNKKEYKKAINAFETAIEFDPREPLAHYFAGLAYYKTEKTDEAVAAWHRAVDVAPNSEAAAKALGKIEYVQGHMARIADELSRRIKEN